MEIAKTNPVSTCTIGYLSMFLLLTVLKKLVLHLWVNLMIYSGEM